MGKKRILFTARDVGAAQQIVHIAASFRREGYRVSVVADEPGSTVLRAGGLEHTLFSKRYGFRSSKDMSSGNSREALLKAAGMILEMENPDIVFCGLSTLGVGIDEAALWWAAPMRKAIPSFQFLDTWGTFNHIGDGYPDVYFVMDRYAEYLGYGGAKAPIRVVGSPKHYAYAGRPIDRWREETRATLGIGNDERLIGYFGQCPDSPGHWHNFEVLVSAVKHCSQRNAHRCRLLVLPHPAYVSGFQPYLDYLLRKEIRYIEPTRGLSIESILAACDIVATSYSTVAVDHAFMSCYSKMPIGAILYLLCGKDIKEHLIKNFGYWKLPLFDMGIGYIAEEDNKVSYMIERMMGTNKDAEEYHLKTKSLSIKDPSGNILDIVSSLAG